MHEALDLFTASQKAAPAAQVPVQVGMPEAAQMGALLRIHAGTMAAR